MEFQNQTALRISDFELLEAGAVRMNWTGAGSGVRIEYAYSLTDPDWRPLLGEGFQLSGSSFTGQLPPGMNGQIFLRIRVSPDGPVPLTTFSSSPQDNEEGVAVTRETIVEFSRPLKDSIDLNQNPIVATFGGRELPGRLHLSRDRTRVTLYYENPLPASARVRVRVDGDRLTDANGRAVDSNGDGSPGGMGAFEFETLDLAALPGTAVVGRVFASELADAGSGETSVNVPLENVTITVDAREDEMRAVTDANGNFRLDPAPAGRFFVHIDGRTASNPTGGDAYYPFVGKAWKSVPGEESNVGDIYLPLVADGTLQTVQSDESTAITFPDSVLEEHPELNGVSLSVPPNALLNDDGTRGGKVGVAPVPPDRLPGRLPPGLNFATVITVQTDGATNFDPPVPACFPNLPDPETGEILPPGAKSALWSFNHDTGQFEVVGPMTVSDDGELICTDPGVGIPAPGWHGTQPGSPPGESPPPTDPCEVDSDSCVMSSALGGMECALSFIPLTGAAQCAFGVARGGLSVMRDAPTGDGADAAIGVGAGVAGAGAACAKGAIQEVPLLGSAISCGAAGVSIVKNCTCAFRETAPQQTALFANEGRSPQSALQDAFVAGLEARVALLEARRTYYSTLLGDPVWTQAAELEAGDPFRAMNQIAGLITEAALAAQAGTDEEQVISQMEADQIRSLPRPSAIGEDDVNALVDYLNRTTEMWRQGLLTHAEAGRSDFIDHAAYLAAIDEMEAALNQLQNAANASDDDALRLAAPIDGMVEFVLEDWEESGGGSFEVPGLYYALVDETNGFTQRGRMTSDHNFELRALRGNAFYRVSYLDPQTFSLGTSVFQAGAAGSVTPIPQTALLSTDDLPDSDQDGLPDEAEFVVGTDPDNPDTSGDGVPDGEAVRQGLDALGDASPRRGLAASFNTGGTAVDVETRQDLAVVAESEGGISVFNIFNGMDPSLVSQTDLPADIEVVAVGNGRIIAAGDSNKLWILTRQEGSGGFDIERETETPGKAAALAIQGDRGFFGTDLGVVGSLDLESGAIRNLLLIDGQAEDLRVHGGYVYALTSDRLWAVQLNGFQVAGVAESPKPLTMIASDIPSRLFVAGSVAYATNSEGYNVFDLSDPSSPVLSLENSTQQNAWKSLSIGGSGLGIAAVGVNEFTGANHNVSLYDVSNPAEAALFLAEYQTPGIARDVAIANGEAYVADGAEGMHVLSFLELDAAGDAPSLVELEAGFEPDALHYGSRAWLSVRARDDLHVSRVEFYRDGERIARDASFPFEHAFRAPDSMSGQTTAAFQARAIDTAGNAAWSATIDAALVQDSEPPQVRIVFPHPGAPASVNASQWKARVIATDNAGVANLRFEIDGNPVNATRQDAGTFLVDASNQLGVRRLQVIAEDQAGLTAASDPVEIEVVDFGSGGEAGIALDASVLGSLNSDETQDRFIFRARSGQSVNVAIEKVSFESGSASWTLTAPDGSPITDGPLESGRSFSRTDLTQSGVYTLAIDGDADVRGDYRLAVASIPPAEHFDLSIGTIVSAGTPANGAGHLELPRSRDVYHLSIDEEGPLYFEIVNSAIELDAFNPVNWRLEHDASGREIFDRLFDPIQPAGRIFLEQTGTYTLTINPNDSPASGAYSIRIWDWPPEGFDIQLGDTVSEGQPEAGAGVIGEAGEFDSYRFTAQAGSRIFAQGTVNELAGEQGFLPVKWILEHESGEVLFETPFSEILHPGRFELDAGGTYFLTVGSRQSDWTGPYGFKLWDLPEDDVFSIDAGDRIAPGVPGAGAGNIEAAGVLDVYRFEANAGDALFFEVVSAGFSGELAAVPWRLLSPSGEELFNEPLIDLADPGENVLPETGEYAVEVGSAHSAALGTYELRIGRPQEEAFAISIGDSIAPDDPGPGAGRIENAGDTDVYEFTAEANQAIFVTIDSLGMQTLELRVEAPDGEIIFGPAFHTAEFSPGRVALEEAGAYKLIAGSETFAETGTYALTVEAASSADSFDIALGDTVEPGVPGPGAGNIESPGAQDVYRFPGASGQTVVLDVIEPSLQSNPEFEGILIWTIENPDGESILEGQMFDLGFGIPSPETVLGQTGEFRVVVGAIEGMDTTGTYSFQIVAN